MEYSVDEFQYDSLPQQLSESIIEKENILNGIKHRYAKEVGKVFYEAQQEFSDYNNGGLFKKWYNSLGFKQRNVYNYIQIYNEVQQLHGDQLETFEELPKRLQLEVSKPSHIPELKKKVLDGDIKTHKEYKELERQLKQRDEQNAQLQSQVEQAQRSESIARKQLEEVENREPEVIEREVVKEVVPDDVKQQLEQFKQKFERESNNANELRDELQRYRNSFSDPNQAYEEKELTRLERESSINAHKIAISIQNFIKENSVETYRLDTVIKANPKSKERLQENVDLLKEFTSNLEAMLNGRIVVN
ncbi:hypothetical protein MTR12_10850 [Staphylococcus agnetis]|uniref:hypothetical protein n=1 Tax=Staphylococcus agnetis TaxID=985762 RepID=UPI00208F8E6D|nr:hypothetical protein [Staphylococcus agnetis]MCO4346644.1 hypothetical protein [Staphylococcus agnetis]MCO4356049.1 hypothetical protein [Staphylococcus agnetis]